jgi:hypothetical protein
MAQELGHHQHHKHQRLQKVEGAADLLTIGFIVVLGLAMVVGLVTASGH